MNTVSTLPFLPLQPLRRSLRSITRPTGLVSLAVIPVLALALVSSGLTSTAAFGSDITVNTLDGGVASDGLCSLAEAVQAANTNAASGDCPAGSGRDRILFAVTGSILLSDEQLIQDDLSIVGPGRDQLSIDGQGNVRHFTVNSGVSLLLAGLEVVNGSPVLAAGTVAGAIYQSLNSHLALIDTRLADNLATNGGGALYLSNDTGAGPYSSLYIEGSTFENNESQGASAGGAIRLGTNASAIIVSSTFLNNRATNFSTPGGSATGGAILAFQSRLTIDSSTFSGNHADTKGGALSLLIAGSELHLSNSTITNNTAAESGGGIDSFNSSVVVIKNNIVSGNSVPGGLAHDLVLQTASFTSLGTNFIGTNYGASHVISAGSPNANGDYASGSPTFLDADLGALLDNGGPTRTHLPNASSDVIDLGACAVESEDQRGFAGGDGRTEGSACDIGAVEFGAVDQEPIFRSTFDAGTDHRWTTSTS